MVLLAGLGCSILVFAGKNTPGFPVITSYRQNEVQFSDYDDGYIPKAYRRFRYSFYTMDKSNTKVLFLGRKNNRYGCVIVRIYVIQEGMAVEQLPDLPSVPLVLRKNGTIEALPDARHEDDGWDEWVDRIYYRFKEDKLVPISDEEYETLQAGAASDDDHSKLWWKPLWTYLVLR